MRHVTLVDIFKHHITRKYLNRSGVHHAVTAAYYAFDLAIENHVSVDLATKAALLHDIGHYEWYNSEGKWDYDEYRQNDIHAIKGAERAHKLLIRLGEDRIAAKQISVAILLHTDSYLPFTLQGKQTPLQEVITLADNKDEQPKGLHHYKKMDPSEAITQLHKLDLLVEASLNKDQEVIG
ncbi:HD domain-containing protein [Pontibacillus litoralis]|uniref:Phosphohydrolase n=1 Tax=Pontibacillus litoralis JSM 072002 TaxID=1385512 RepID=A0A0A5G6W8_9BACI|nr:HD domain-containing protein [Pontibacillus litoralis]KGX86913.1 phosphohydrolase [Pontibacillus litoralis JSM 072002]